MMHSDMQRTLPRIWESTSWKKYAALQQPAYTNRSLLYSVLSELENSPNLVTEEEILNTKYWYSEAAKGKAFILQAGDCSEAFAECTQEIVQQKVSFLSFLSGTLQNSLQKPVISIGRIAGQFAKPRTEEYEEISGVLLPCYRGDIINGYAFEKKARIPDPTRMLLAYQHANNSVRWIREQKKNAPFFISHEALLLDYESAFTRKAEARNHSLRNYRSNYYNFLAHTVWLGERTRDSYGAHVEYLSGISNPIGIKIGPSTKIEEILNLLSLLNPYNEPGKIMLITRLGCKTIEKVLPKFIRTLAQAQCKVTWSVDPMHGNTHKTFGGLKTRYLEEIWQELKTTVAVHEQENSILGGVHLEISPHDVTECVGGNLCPNIDVLKQDYRSLCDPRLNAEQSKILIENLKTIIK